MSTLKGNIWLGLQHHVLYQELWIFYIFTHAKEVTTFSSGNSEILNATSLQSNKHVYIIQVSVFLPECKLRKVVTFVQIWLWWIFTHAEEMTIFCDENSETAYYSRVLAGSFTNYCTYKLITVCQSILPHWEGWRIELSKRTLIEINQNLPGIESVL